MHPLIPATGIIKTMESTDYSASKLIDALAQKGFRTLTVYQMLGFLVTLWVLYLAGEAFYNLFLHPLAGVPGPIHCRISKTPWV
jgi:hypothetical protein